MFTENSENIWQIPRWRQNRGPLGCSRLPSTSSGQPPPLAVLRMTSRWSHPGRWREVGETHPEQLLRVLLKACFDKSTSQAAPGQPHTVLPRSGPSNRKENHSKEDGDNGAGQMGRRQGPEPIVQTHHAQSATSASPRPQGRGLPPGIPSENPEGTPLEELGQGHGLGNSRVPRTHPPAPLHTIFLGASTVSHFQLTLGETQGQLPPLWKSWWQSRGEIPGPGTQARLLSPPLRAPPPLHPACCSST